MVADTDINGLEGQIRHLELRGQATVKTINDIERSIAETNEEIMQLKRESGSRRKSQVNTPEALEA